ncbi:MAG: hypothetical protein HS128_21645 [Ideonella sp.]|nr:hypothetical protein [Ideonella sp.]MCC7457635.1 hypothetical protein [Nitrospira sp.]
MPPGLRVKSQWFRTGAPRSPEQQAGAMAFIVWRTAQHLLKRMRNAGFDIDAGEPYFAFLGEVVVFLIAVVDRHAHARLGAAREAFTRELVLRCAATFGDNAADLLPPRRDGRAHDDAFIDLCNDLSRHYAEFGAADDADAAGFAPDFAFVRYLGSRLTATVPDKDSHWVLDQVIAVEAPEAVAIVRSAFADLSSPRPRAARRAALSGD